MYLKVEYIYDINISILFWNRLRGIYDVNNKILFLIFQQIFVVFIDIIIDVDREIFI